MKNYEYPGAIHIHTKYSDGTSSIEDIVKYAKKAGLNWIIITDHNNIEGLKNGKEGYYDDVCVLVGTEISPGKSNHYLALDVYEEISEELAPAEFIKKVNDLGGFGFVAHPDEKTPRENNYPALRWEDWSINGFQGLEIWNYMSDWVDTLNEKNKLKKFLRPQSTLQGPTLNVMKWWDDLNNKNGKIVPAIAGLDVHAFEYKYFGFNLKVFPYDKSFKTLKNWIHTDGLLSKDFETAKKQIYSALKAGNNMMINHALGTPKNLVFTAIKREDQRYIKAVVGEFLEIEDSFFINIELPEACDIKLYKNGELLKQQYTDKLKTDLEDPGSYRFEAHKNNQHWILSNPIRVVKNNV